MSKISAKMRAAQMEKQKESAPAALSPIVEGPDGLPMASKTAPVPPAPASPLAALFEAAKKGDVEMATKAIVEDGVDVNAKVRVGGRTCHLFISFLMVPYSLT